MTSGLEPDIPEQVLSEARRFIAAVPWTFAKTVPHMPHEYVIRVWEQVPTEGFDRFVQLTRAHGYRARWHHPDKHGVSYTNHYLEVDGWAYWLIPPGVLNRERLEHDTRERI